jgi:hypothetical protein
MSFFAHLAAHFEPSDETKSHTQVPALQGTIHPELPKFYAAALLRGEGMPEGVKSGQPATMVEEA